MILTQEDVKYFIVKQVNRIKKEMLKIYIEY